MYGWVITILRRASIWGFWGSLGYHDYRNFIHTKPLLVTKNDDTVDVLDNGEMFTKSWLQSKGVFWNSLAQSFVSRWRTNKDGTCMATYQPSSVTVRTKCSLFVSVRLQTLATTTYIHTYIHTLYMAVFLYYFSYM